MHVAWIVYGALDQPTGGYVYDRLVVEGMRAAGARVDVLPLSSGEPHESLAARIARCASDVIVGDALCVAEVGPAFELAPAGARRVLLVHHFTSWEIEVDDRAPLRRVEARAITASDAIVATSEATSARVHGEHGRAALVVTPGADRLPRIDRAPRDPSRLRLLFVGSVVPRKRLSLLLDALDRLDDAPIALSLVGDSSRDPDHAAAVRAQIAASPRLVARVVERGVVDDVTLAGELARADALVLPSSLEGYGMAAAESLRAGVPVIAARAAAIPGVVDEGQGAALFDDAGDLAALLDRLASDASFRDTLDRGAARRARELPTWRDATSAFVAALALATASRA